MESWKIVKTLKMASDRKGKMSHGIDSTEILIIKVKSSSQWNCNEKEKVIKLTEHW